MAERKAKTGSLCIPSVKNTATSNPKVDAEKVREAQELLEELRKAGVSPRGYEITSPYERRPLKAWRDASTIEEQPKK